MDTGAKFENVVVCYKAKTSSDKKGKKKEYVPCPLASACDPGCPNRKENRDKDEKRERKAKRDKDKESKPCIKKPSKNPKNFSDIGSTASVNCCTCCHVFAQYLAEVAKLVCCVSNGAAAGAEESKISELFCTMMELMSALGQDACNLVKLVYRCLFVSK